MGKMNVCKCIDRKIENLLDVCMCYLVMWLSGLVFVIYIIMMF